MDVPILQDLKHRDQDADAASTIVGALLERMMRSRPENTEGKA
jgi:hypothetical protein